MSVVDILKLLALLTGLLPQVVEAVKAVEATIQAAKAGAYKRELVITLVSEVLDVADDFVQLNRDFILRVVGKVIDVVVALYNLKGVFTHAENETPIAPPA